MFRRENTGLLAVTQQYVPIGICDAWSAAALEQRCKVTGCAVGSCVIVREHACAASCMRMILLSCQSYEAVMTLHERLYQI